MVWDVCAGPRVLGIRSSAVAGTSIQRGMYRRSDVLLCVYYGALRGPDCGSYSQFFMSDRAETSRESFLRSMTRYSLIRSVSDSSSATNAEDTAGLAADALFDSTIPSMGQPGPSSAGLISQYGPSNMEEALAHLPVFTPPGSTCLVCLTTLPYVISIRS